MFESKAAMFMYAVSPVHAGAGTALGAIDNPIQRERHTEHPMIAGSGVKGALRHEADQGKIEKDEIAVIFGPDTNASDHAGSLSISDAQLVLFPVRSLKRSYVYATSPTALGRLKRLLELAGVEHDWSVPEVKSEETALCAEPGPLQSKNANQEQIVLEVFGFKPEASTDTKKVAAWIAQQGLPSSAGTSYFAKKIETDLVVLHDNKFNYFVRNATVVEPHVRIDDKSGTADGRGLFYTENLPPESLLVSLVMASGSRKKGHLMEAPNVLKSVRDGFDGKMVQVGGNATVGRGQMLVRFAGEG